MSVLTVPSPACRALTGCAPGAEPLALAPGASPERVCWCAQPAGVRGCSGNAFGGFCSPSFFHSFLELSVRNGCSVFKTLLLEAFVVFLDLFLQSRYFGAFPAFLVSCCCASERGRINGHPFPALCIVPLVCKWSLISFHAEVPALVLLFRAPWRFHLHQPAV